MKIQTKNSSIAVLGTFAIAVGMYYTGTLFSFTGFSFSWILHFILMAWFSYLADKFPLALTSGYFDAKPFERRGVIYRYLGVDLYRKMLVKVGWENIRPKKGSIENNLQSLRQSEYETRSSEFMHAIMAVIVAVVTLLVADSLQEAKWLIAFNVLFNIYPAIVQRYNRPRLRRVLALTGR